MSAVMRGLIDQPTTSRLNRSSTTARYSQPSPVWMYVMSPVHTRLGASGVKLRASTLGATGIECLESVVALKRRLWRARIPLSRISRSTRGRPMRWPRPCSSRCIRREP